MDATSPNTGLPISHGLGPFWSSGFSRWKAASVATPVGAETGSASSTPWVASAANAAGDVPILRRAKPSRNTAETVWKRMTTSRQNDQLSMYRLSNLARSTMEVSPRSPWICANPVRPAGTR